MKTFRVFPKISSAPYPPGTPAPRPLLVKAKDEKSALREAAKLHGQAHTFTIVSEWTAVEERT